LGTVFAAFNALTKPHPEECEALQMGAGLAKLAIETRRLYSDLVHRSEFDQLTEIQNRFSLEKHMDTMIQAARESAGIFGLIYIDLDKFKQVNDLYGHQIGDLYLQQVAARMKHQLRPCDLLARLGGDEFGVLLPSVHNRSDVEEVALRLEHCMNDPFDAGNLVLQGSASFGIAIYPVDAATRDSLLSAADAARYAAKHSKKTNADMQAISTHHDLTSEARK
jgi:diguanylate cyclase (GGDEF)-like protein